MIELKPAVESDLRILMTWLHTADEARIWGGPRITFPFEWESFKKQIQWTLNRSFTIFDDNKMVGFAQIALRYGNHHLCRVLVDPVRRGEGLGEKLLELVIATDEEESLRYSLFVYDDNEVAINLYRKLGFSSNPIPDGVTNMDRCLYMVR